MAAHHRPLNAQQLLAVVLDAVDQAGWQAITLSARKPFRLRIHGGEDKGFDVSVYIWNCTHGGGSARAADEYRIQLTSVVPALEPGVTTLLLGWHAGYGVFVAFDIARHSGQDSASPSIQVNEETLSQAHTKAFAQYRRGNGEVAVAFRPEFLVDYALSAKSLHSIGAASKDMALLNQLSEVSDAEIAAIPSAKRRIVIAQIARKYRAHDFRSRVLGAYGHRCAFCSVQLNVLDAAHIVPVADEYSSDATSNGLALCKLHHAAFDRNLVAITESLQIETSEFAVQQLRSLERDGGWSAFRRNLRPAILLPSDRRDYPDRRLVARARQVRNWRA